MTEVPVDTDQVRTELRSAFVLVVHARGHRKALLDGMEHWTVGGPGTYEPYIEMKHFVEDLRSALDYMAMTVRTHYCSGADEPIRRRIYMPIQGETEPYDRFLDRFDVVFPDLRTRSPELARILLDDLSEGSTSGEGLQLLPRIAGEAKHSKLSEFTRQITGHAEWTGPGGSLSMVPHLVWFVAGEEILVTSFLRNALEGTERVLYAFLELVGPSE